MNILLDYDGTIHNTLSLYFPAFQRAYAYLVEKNLAPIKTFTPKEVSYWLGFSPKAMWDHFMPDLEEKEKNCCIKKIGDAMTSLLFQNKATLYDGAIEMLQALKDEKHTLIFLSNCTHDYMENHRKYFHLDQYYHGFYCSENYGYAPKTTIFQEIKKDFPGEYIVVGDRFYDIEIAQKFHLPSVGCAYGFGRENELVKSDFLIQHPMELVFLLKNFS